MLNIGVLYYINIVIRKPFYKFKAYLLLLTVIL